MNIDHTALSDILRETAAREILPLWQNLQQHQIEQKQPGDLVTVADRASEERISRALLKLLPGSLVVGEEAVHRDPAVLRALDSKRPVWVIDPLDGTANFAAGAGPIAIMVCLIQRHETLAAWIYDPVADTLLAGELGAGAQLNEQPVLLSPYRGETASICGALSTRYLPTELQPGAEAGSEKLGLTRASGCAGYDYRALLTGEYQFLFYYRTLVWDHAPGVLLAREAGAHTARYNGQDYRPVDACTGLICAVDPAIWRTVSSLLLPA